MIQKELDRLLLAAKNDATLKADLLKTRETDNPVEDFCAMARSRGYEIYAGDLLALGLNESDAKLRSVNGGGVNAIDGWDDAYEQFFISLIWSK